MRELLGQLLPKAMAEPGIRDLFVLVEGGEVIRHWEGVWGNEVVESRKEIHEIWKEFRIVVNGSCFIELGVSREM